MFLCAYAIHYPINYFFIWFFAGVFTILIFGFVYEITNEEYEDYFKKNNNKKN